MNDEVAIGEGLQAADGETLVNYRPSAATLYEAAGRRGALPNNIRPIENGFRLYGSALTVELGVGNNLWLHRCLEIAMAGDVIVGSVGAGEDFGYWGEVLTTAAKSRGVVGLVLNGCVRDAESAAILEFPIFSTGMCIRGTEKQFDALGSMRKPISIGDARIETGDLVVGDADGLVVVPRGQIHEVMSSAVERDRHEQEIMRRIQQGEMTMDIYELPRDRGKGI